MTVNHRCRADHGERARPRVLSLVEVPDVVIPFSLVGEGGADGEQYAKFPSRFNIWIGARGLGATESVDRMLEPGRFTDQLFKEVRLVRCVLGGVGTGS